MRQAGQPPPRRKAGSPQSHEVSYAELMTSSAQDSTSMLDRALDVVMVVGIFIFGTLDTWITTGEAGEPAYLLSVLLIAVGLTLWLVASFIDTSPEPPARRWRVRKPYLAEVFFWGYATLMLAGFFFDLGIIDVPSVLIAVSGLVTAKGTAGFLYARGVKVW
jgi:hypothetical protein